MAEQIVLKIGRLAGLGDGCAMVGDEKWFVPYTVPGDVVRARVLRHTKDASYAALGDILTAGPARVEPVCVHFGECGGCSLQQLEAGAYNEFKQTMAQEAVRKAGFDPALTRPLIRLNDASRRRADLKYEKNQMGFYAARSHRLIDIRQCAVLEPELFALAKGLKKLLFDFHSPLDLHLNGADEGYDLLIRGDGTGLETLGWASLPNLQRASHRFNEQTTTLYSRGPVTLTIGKARVALPEGAFLQASREAQSILTRLVCEGLQGASRVADLFAGVGTYSFALAETAQVDAFEGEDAQVAALQEAALAASLPVVARTRDLFASPLSPDELSVYAAAVINPPRVGAPAQTAAIAASGLSRLVMVSCNPATFSRDARTLQQAGFNLVHATPLDQFVYSSHLEIIAQFAR